MRMVPKAVFITATDTGVGKTVIAAALALCLGDRGRVAAFKPIESGVPSRDGEPADSEILAQASDLRDSKAASLYRLKCPLAPAVAAEMEGVPIQPNRILRCIRSLRQSHDYLLVEGIGGVRVPILWDYSVLDLMSDLALPVLLVARSNLGTLNHTLLTLDAIQNRGLQTWAVLLNGQSPDPGIDEQTNPGALKKLTGLDRIAVLPRYNGRQSQQVIRSLRPEIQRHLLEGP